jgi:hypothetical protein
MRIASLNACHEPLTSGQCLVNNTWQHETAIAAAPKIQLTPNMPPPYPDNDLTYTPAKPTFLCVKSSPLIRGYNRLLVP